MNNIVDIFEQEANKHPSQQAIVDFCYQTQCYKAVSFSELSKLINHCAFQLESRGVSKSMRAIIGIKPSLDFVIYTLALLKLGAIPVFIDSGMAKKKIIECVDRVKPHILLGGLKFQIICRLFCRIKPLLRLNYQKIHLSNQFDNDIATEIIDDNDLAAIIFTSGSTGSAKGVEYQHCTFIEQIKVIKKIYQVSENDRDLSIFPLFSVLAVTMGMTSIIPAVDMAHPARISCRLISNLIEEQKISFSFGSPTFWQNMAEYCKKQKISLPTLRAVIMAGCSVPANLHRNLLAQVLPDGQCYVPYGATEALPITSFSGREVLQFSEQLTNEGKGTCVGKLTSDQFIIKIIKVTDEKIIKWNDNLCLPLGQVGEICVKGPTVTRHYFDDKEADAKAKINDGEELWHRMGDVGYFDKQGNLWFCGRKADIVQLDKQTLYTDQCENIFNCLDGVNRTALVKSSQELVLFVEPEIGVNTEKLKIYVLAYAQKYKMTHDIKRVILNKKFPVDIRHNAKIKRDILKKLL